MKEQTMAASDIPGFRTRTVLAAATSRSSTRATLAIYTTDTCTAFMQGKPRAFALGTSAAQAAEPRD
jgi:hypothetical protein